jgi:hypothetical protein
MKPNVLSRYRLGRGLLLGVALVAVASAIAGPANAVAWPNPCTLLTRLHAQTTITKGHAVAVKIGTATKSSIETTCSTSVGKLSIGLVIGPPSANNLAVPSVISESSVAGLGANAVVVLGRPTEGGGTNGQPLDYVGFYKSGLFVGLTVSNGTTTKANLVALATRLYALVG